MALFGKKEEDGPADEGLAAVNAEIDRIAALPVTQLAAELMAKAFGPDGPGGPGKPGTLEAPAGQERVGLDDICRIFTPAFTDRAAGQEQTARIGMLVGEGLQSLEHASLVRLSWRSGFENYRATRLGRAAVEGGAVERILAGGSL